MCLTVSNTQLKVPNIVCTGLRRQKVKIHVVWNVFFCTYLRTVCLCAVRVSPSPSVSINLSAAMESDDSDVRCIIWCVLLTTLSSAAPTSRLWSLPVCCVTQIVTSYRGLHNTVTPLHKHNMSLTPAFWRGGRGIHFLAGRGGSVK